MVWHEFMGKRGPTPVDVGLLNTWEFEFYKNFHLLRDGIMLPGTYASSASGFSPRDLRRFLEQLKQMSAGDYWQTSRRVGVELGQKLNLGRPPSWLDRHWAAQEREREILWLERTLNPPRIQVQTERRKMWTDLVKASTNAALRKVCERWAQIPNVRARGLQVYPGHILSNAAGFFDMKRNKRFPRSEYADNARIEYLARGMAGLLVGVSPMTAIERLRNMKHQKGGPLWDNNENYCRCWRCSRARSNKVSKISGEAYENGLRLFVELASKAKRPK